MKKIKNKGFTLIELLVVVAIIGILAAVGVTAYSGYTSSAKIATAKANQKSVIKWIAAEAQKCQLGFDIIMNGEVSIPNMTAFRIIMVKMEYRTFAELSHS